MPKKPQFKMTGKHYAALKAIKDLKPESEFSLTQPTEGNIRRKANKTLKGAFTGPATVLLTQLVNLGLVSEKSSQNSSGIVYFLTERGESILSQKPNSIPLEIRDQTAAQRVQCWEGVSRGKDTFGDLTKG